MERQAGFIFMSERLESQQAAGPTEASSAQTEAGCTRLGTAQHSLH